LVVYAGREKAFEAVAALADHDLKDEDHPLFHIIINRQLKRILREEALQQGTTKSHSRQPQPRVVVHR